MPSTRRVSQQGSPHRGGVVQGCPGGSRWRAVPSPGSGSLLCPPSSHPSPDTSSARGQWDPKAAQEGDMSQQQAGGDLLLVPHLSPRAGCHGALPPHPKLGAPVGAAQTHPPHPTPVSILSLCRENGSQEHEATGPATLSPSPRLPGDMGTQRPCGNDSGLQTSQVSHIY